MAARRADRAELGGRVLLLAVALSVGSGCYRSFELADADRLDGGTDGGLAGDAGSPECASMAGYCVCEPISDQPCPRETARSCAEHIGVCLPNRPGPVTDPRDSFVTCSLGEDVESSVLDLRQYCWRQHQFCAADPLREERLGKVQGPCITEELCRALPDAGVPGRCRYSDGTFFVDGPPEVASCPAPESGLCGGPCGDCPWVSVSDSTTDYHFSCAGVSERRGLGICSFGVFAACSAENLRESGRCSEGGFDRECACATFRVDGTEQTLGWQVFRESCLTYRALFPDDVECHALDTWEVL